MMKLETVSGLVLAATLLAGCQTTRDPALSGSPVADAGTVVSGAWGGHFINTHGTRYGVTFHLEGVDGKVSGSADIPSSSFDKNPKVTGSYAGSAVTFSTSSGFTYNTQMTTDGKGRYALSGPVSGPNIGTVELFKK